MRQQARYDVRVRDGNGVWTTVEHDAYIDIDLDAIIGKLVNRAARAKTMRATGMNGAIKVRVKRVS